MDKISRACPEDFLTQHLAERELPGKAAKAAFSTSSDLAALGPRSNHSARDTGQLPPRRRHVQSQLPKLITALQRQDVEPSTAGDSIALPENLKAALRARFSQLESCGSLGLPLKEVCLGLSLQWLRNMSEEATVLSPKSSERMGSMRSFDTTVHARVSQSYYEHEQAQTLDAYKPRLQTMWRADSPLLSNAEMQEIEMAASSAAAAAGELVNLKLTPMFVHDSTPIPFKSIGRGHGGHQLSPMKVAELGEAMQSAQQGILSYYYNTGAHATAFRIQDGKVLHFDPNIGELSYPLAKLLDVLESCAEFGYSGLNAVQLMRAESK